MNQIVKERPGEPGNTITIRASHHPVKLVRRRRLDGSGIVCLVWLGDPPVLVFASRILLWTVVSKQSITEVEQYKTLTRHSYLLPSSSQFPYPTKRIAVDQLPFP
jgi:hypothetical protein